MGPRPDSQGARKFQSRAVRREDAGRESTRTQKGHSERGELAGSTVEQLFGPEGRQLRARFRIDWACSRSLAPSLHLNEFGDA